MEGSAVSDYLKRRSVNFAGPRPEVSSVTKQALIRQLQGLFTFRKKRPDRSSALRVTISISLIGCIFSVGDAYSNPDSDLPESLFYHARYHFQLTEGLGKAVCTAYVKELNTAHFSRPPQCGIPDFGHKPGFTAIACTPLSIHEAEVLYPRVWGFTFKQQQVDELFGESKTLARDNFGRSLQAWRFTDPISVSNDSTPDNVLVWQGPALYEAVQDSQCGQYVADAGGEGQVERSARLAFVLTPDNLHIDEKRTRLLFGRYANAAEPTDAVLQTEINHFQSLGSWMGFFKFEGKVYMQTFYDGVNGDIYGRRKNDRSMRNSLAVLLRQDAKTEQICEIRMTEIPKKR